MRVTSILLVCMLLIWAVMTVDEAWGERDAAVERSSKAFNRLFSKRQNKPKKKEVAYICNAYYCFPLVKDPSIVLKNTTAG